MMGRLAQGRIYIVNPWNAEINLLGDTELGNAP